MSSAVYFLSDVHLGASPSGCVADREERLIALLRGWQGRAAHLFILGDLFEFWMEYRHYVGRRHFGVLRALADLVDSGCKVSLLRGNHDFAYESFFPESLGISVHSALITELQGRRLFLCHGDGLARSDRAYRLARRVIDHPLNRFLFRLLHPDWGMALASWVGGSSRNAHQNRAHPVQEYLDAAQALMEQHRCDLFVHGHLHLGAIWDVPAGQVLNCGQWLFRLGYAELTEGVCVYHEIPA